MTPRIKYHLSARGGGSRLWSQCPRVKEEGLLWIWSQPGHQGESLSRKQDTQKQWLIILFFFFPRDHLQNWFPFHVDWAEVDRLGGKSLFPTEPSHLSGIIASLTATVSQVVWSLRLVKILADVIVMILTWLSTIWSWSVIDFLKNFFRAVLCD